MPLVKSTSKAAFRKNIKAEMGAGKPQKQAVAIAYSVKRAAASKGKEKMQGLLKQMMAAKLKAKLGKAYQGEESPAEEPVQRLARGLRLGIGGGRGGHEKSTAAVGDHGPRQAVRGGSPDYIT